MKITDVITEAASPAQQAAIAISMKKAGNKPKQGVAEGLNEFAADDGNDGGGKDDALRNYARMWWTGDEATQMQIERALAKMGWEIGEDEGGYDNGGVFVVRAGDENGNSYTSWAAEDLTEGVAEGYQLDEGAIETITALVKKIPGIGKYYQMAQQYKPQLIEILRPASLVKKLNKRWNNWQQVSLLRSPNQV